MTKFNQAKENNEESFIITHPILIENQKEIEVETHFTSINYSDKILDLAIMHDIEEKKIREREKIEHEKFLTVSSFAITANDKINSPLNAILGYTELLDIQLTDKNKTQINAFRNIYDSISIIQKILRRLKSLTNVTLKSYNLEDFKMLKIEDEDDET
jgi:nitrogen-specific signal transduction histidine kinase